MPEPTAAGLDAALAELAARYRECYQCGQCTSACPSALDFTSGPRHVVRLLLSGESERVLSCEDIWRCSECGACSRACPMELDVAGLMSGLRGLELRNGDQRGPERRAAEVATRRLERRARLGNVSFGASMALQGHLPRDWGGAARVVGRTIARAFSPRAGGTERTRLPAGEAPGEAAPIVPFYAGCALRQDRPAWRATVGLARSLGFPLVEHESDACCGHPTRGERPSPIRGPQRLLTACPGCDAALRAAGATTESLLEALVERARQARRRLAGEAPAFVPYVGCMGDRDHALDSFRRAAELGDLGCEIGWPSLHAGCCGALSGFYRGETRAAQRLLDFAVERRLPIVCSCLLCRDNLRSAARRRGLDTRVFYWSEFLHAAAREDAPGEENDE